MLTPPPMVPIMESGIIPPRFAEKICLLGLLSGHLYGCSPLKDLPGKSLSSRDDVFHSCRDGSPLPLIFSDLYTLALPPSPGYMQLWKN